MSGRTSGGGSFAWQGSCRVPDNDGTRSNILDDDCTSADDRSLANHPARQDRGAKADQRRLTDGAVPSKVSPRSDVHLTSDATVVIQSAGGIEDRVGAHLNLWIQDHPGAHHRPFP